MEKEILVLPIIVIILSIIAEIFGRSKHIGRWWSFFLLLGGLLPGIIAIVSSPSAKSNPTKANNQYKYWAIIFLIFGLLNLLTLIISEGITGFMSIPFFIIGYYLYELSKGVIINRNPHFYFKNDIIPKNHSSDLDKSFINSQKTQFKYFIISEDQQEGPFSYNDLGEKNISKDTYIWRNGLENWCLAGDLKEIEELIFKVPPTFIKPPEFRKQTEITQPPNFNKNG